MKQNADVWCVAQGEAATSALAWTSEGGGLDRGGKKCFYFLLEKLVNLRLYATAC
jgi:hypothetical protein